MEKTKSGVFFKGAIMGAVVGGAIGIAIKSKIIWLTLIGAGVGGYLASKIYEAKSAPISELKKELNIDGVVRRKKRIRTIKSNNIL